VSTEQIIDALQLERYPPEARSVALAHLQLLRALPTGFTPLLLQQIQEYDWRFPAERREITGQLAYLEAMNQEQRSAALAGFARLRLPLHWSGRQVAGDPSQSAEQLADFLWATHQMDAFREASSAYMSSYRATTRDQEPTMRRLGVAIIGQGVDQNSYPLFRKLRSHGTYFSNVAPANGLRILLEAVAARSMARGEAFAHWYVEGGLPQQSAAPVAPPLLVISYEQLRPARQAVLAKMNQQIRSGIAGPESLLTELHQLRPEDLGLPAEAGQSVFNHFIVSLLTAGSGTQLFSTTFVQWTVRELWRRAQPLTILARFAPRQRERPMNELLSNEATKLELDPMGSLIDADMGAFYMWLDEQRLPGAKQSSFLAWFEGHNQALVVGPGLPANTASDQSVDMQWLLRQVTT
jgi:hypothetical protein